MPLMKKCSQWLIPTTGNTITIPSFDGPIFVQFVDPAGLLATINIVLPSAVDGQIVRIVSSKTLTLVNLSSAVGVVLGAITTLLANSSFAYTWSEDSQQWFKV